MVKSEYLLQPHVTEFCIWFAERLESAELAHSWEDRRTRQIVRFQNIYDAYKQYKWQFNLLLPNEPSRSGASYAENHNALTTLQTGLRHAIDTKNDTDTLNWSHAVLRWGGVFPKNGRWLTENQKGLAEYLAKRAQRLGNKADDTELTEFSRFNSGITKIYSLLVDDFVIYDTRVAAAFGWAIVNYCQGQYLKEIPEDLRFPWGAAKEAPKTLRPKQRNPSVDGLNFRNLKSGAEYARWNLRASWLLSEVVRNTQSAFRNLDDPIRALEAALFMVGYDLGSSATDQTAIFSQPETQDRPDTTIDKNPYLLTTRGSNAQAVSFNYEYTDSHILIRTENNREHLFEDYKAEEILTSLYRQFRNGWFPLANNVEKLGKSNEISGLGMTILGAYPGNTTLAQAASYFGPVMEDMGLFEWNGKNRGIKWRLTCEPHINLPDSQD